MVLERPLAAAIAKGGAPMHGIRTALAGPNRLLALGLALTLALAYTLLNLHAAWDPVSRLTNIRAGIVNEDQSVMVSGAKVAIGEDLSRTLLEGKKFGWRTLSLDDARYALGEGAIDFYLYIPKDASQRVVGLPTQTDPKQAILQMHVDPAYNYPMNAVADSVAAAIREELNGKITATYLERLLGGIDGAVSGIAEAADGARTIANGMKEADDGAARLADGLMQAETGAAELASGSTTLRKGSEELVGGYADLAKHNEALTAGLNDAVQGVRQIKQGVQDSLSQPDPELARMSAEIEKSMKRIVIHWPLLLLDPQYHRLAKNLKGLGARADQLQQQSVAKLNGGLTQLETGLIEVRDGSAKIAAGARGAHTKGQAYLAGMKRLEAGTYTLSDGIGQAHTGAAKLAEGTAQLADGTERLASALGAGTEGAVIPRRENVDAMSRPIQVVGEKLHPVPKPGEALLALVIPIALWIGAMALTVADRVLGSGWSAGETVWERVRFMALPGAALTLTVYGLSVLMGPSVKHPLLLLFITALAAAAFLALNQMLVRVFGAWGFGLSGVLLILMPVAVGSRVPYLMLPAIYRFAAPVLPLSHGVRGVQSTITGGAWSIFWISLLFLAAFLGLSLLVSHWSEGRRAEISEGGTV
jgi:putative membrane protein